MPDIIIHGASGFLGKHFLRKLIIEKIPAIVLARTSSNINEFKNNNLVKIYRYSNSISELSNSEIGVSGSVFFEFSWQGVFGSERNNEEQLDINIPLISDSITIAHKLNVKHWVGVGSQAEYGNLDKRISEKDACNPTTLYGKAKLHCSQISAELCQKFGMEHSWLRLFSVYGPDDNHMWLIQYLIKEMVAGKEINVTKGEQLWDYLYIDDVSEMFFKLKDAKGVGVANLGSGKAVQVKYIIEKIKELTNSVSKVNFGAVPYRFDQVMLMEADISKLSKHLNWIPEINIDEGLEKTISHLKLI
ncbi:MAG TPA: NAD(P)-dependent oxidoreductase [Bacteroidia bacterium]|nr:NAD(P)-dependent oxidoreductase [Bacteroidia bacterium]HNU33862.1 NAD(P)-dependent oxidoreductase [Bacteroidia bacterium]